MKRALVGLVIVTIVGAGGITFYLRRTAPDIGVTTATVTRGDLVDTVAATGTLQAVTTVQVGSQVSGNISWLGADFNSIVKKNQVLAKLDPSLFQAQVEQAKANLLKSEADVVRAKVGLTDAQQKFVRTNELAAKNLVPPSDLDAAQIAVDSADAALKSADATRQQAQATLNQNQVNLDHTIITAPIDGIVTQRSIDVGQTVAASLQSPTLFILAADLTKMQVNANVDEADVGRIRPGQRVTFRVDAYPSDPFTGTVAQIRLQPVVVQNVTTYGTVIDVPNNDLKLKPGMTANVKIEVARRSNVLRVPNTAIRFRPSPDVFASLNQPVPSEAQFGGRGGRGGRNGRAPSSAAAIESPSAPGARGTADPTRPASAERTVPPTSDTAGSRVQSRGHVRDSEGSTSARLRPKYGAAQSAQTIDALFAPVPIVETGGRVWTFVGRKLEPIVVRLGVTDGTNTELVRGDLQEGLELVTGVTGVVARSQGATGANPLLGTQPRTGGPGGFPGGGGGGGGGRGR